MNKKETTLSKFTKYTLLNVMSMIGLSCYILADTYFISNGLGADGLTALNLAIPVYSFINGCGLMLGVGGATRYAIFRAQKQKEEGNCIFMNMIYVAAVLGILFVVLGLGFSSRLTVLLGADEQVFAMTDIYIKMILLFSPAFMLNNIINCFVRNDGNPGLSMLAMLAGSFLNIVMDYIFIFPMGLGMFGAVLATGFAPIAGLMVLSIHFIKKQNGFGFRRASMSLERMISSVSIGVPSFVTEVSSGIVMIIFNLLILGLAGNVGVAAYGVVANIAIVVLSIYNGIAQGMQPVVSDSFGRGEAAETGKVLKYGMITMLMVSAFMYLVLFVKANEVALLFNRDQDMVLQRIAIKGMKLYFAAIPFAGFNIVLSSYFASVEKAVPAQVISLLRGIVLVIPVVFVMAHLWELTGVWLSFAVTEIVTVAVGIGLFMKHRKKNLDERGRERMNIQIFGTKKCFDTKKAQRFFKERGVKVQFIDLKEKGMSKGEFRSVKQSVGGLDEMLDQNCKDQDAFALVKYIADSDKEEKILANQQILKTPIVRNGKEATVGYQPEVWKNWK